MDIILTLFKKNGLQKTFSLSSAVTIIGRRQDCDLCIPLMSVSRRHCQLNSNADSLKIRDLNSLNGTYLNGKPINEAMAKAGDYLMISPLTFLIQINGQPKEIVPPKQPSEKPAKEEKPTATEPQFGEPEDELLADEGSFAELELDGTDTDLAELEDL